METKELREMGDEQLQDTLTTTCDSYFRLRMQAQTERLDAPTELRRHRRLIARIKTLQREREIVAGADVKAAAATSEAAAAPKDDAAAKA